MNTYQTLCKNIPHLRGISDCPSKNFKILSDMQSKSFFFPQTHDCFFFVYTIVTVFLIFEVCFLRMFLKKRKHKKDAMNLARARECLRTHNFSDNSTFSVDSVVSGDEIRMSEPDNMENLLNLSQEAANTDDEGQDPSFNLDSSLKSDTQHQIETICEEWVVQLSKDDRYSLGIFLEYHLNVTLRKSMT